MLIVALRLQRSDGYVGFRNAGLDFKIEILKYNHVKSFKNKNYHWKASLNLVNLSVASARSFWAFVRM